MAGSNDLNLLLKSQVVKVKAELDVKGSLPKIKKQITEISKLLESKPVKLKVQLDISVAELNKQLRAIKTRMETSKTFKPLKIGVEIDSKNLKGQLKEVQGVMDKYSKAYASQTKKMQADTVKAKNQMDKTMSSGATGKNNAVAWFDSKQYEKEISRVKHMMKSTFGKGSFASFETKDAQGNLKGFIGQLEKANGVVQKVRYEWDKGQKSFVPIGQETINTIERNVKKAKSQLQSLYADVEKLNKGKGKSNLFNQYGVLEEKAKQGTLNTDQVAQLKRQIKEEQVLQGQIKEQNSLLNARKKLLSDIKAMSKSINDINNRSQFNDSMKNARTAKDLDALKQIRLETTDLTRRLKEQENVKKNDLAIAKQRLQMLREIRKLEATTGNGTSSEKRFMAQTKAMAEQARTAKELEKVLNRMNRIKDGSWKLGINMKEIKTIDDIKNKLIKLQQIGGITKTQFNQQMRELADGSGRSLDQLRAKLSQVSSDIQKRQREIKTYAQQQSTLLDGNKALGTADRTNYRGISKAVASGDVKELQKYIGQLYKGQVETIKFSNQTDSAGRAVQRLQIRMQGAGKTVRTYTVDLDRQARMLREVSKGTDYNANRNLGVFEQLKVAMARVPVWMASMTAFYGSIRMIRNFGTEILKIDKSMTDLRRVASDDINVGVIFEGASRLAKELGNDIHDIMNSLVEFSRTFGEFNERQLLAITKTATLMANVSDLSAQEASESLVGTMNAFGILADESIVIADSFNEVDNNFAISTKQLAEGMSKGASTAKTFGVSMEESIGHITAIGSVTMESGKIIGNSLKTIYSRITTMADAEGVLKGIGIGVKDIEGNVRPVNDILSELGEQWYTLTDAERQNISVKIAGRYQLSRFLALMNNWGTATSATTTALTSQGSAVRENQKYMKSYEARINQMKNTFTELSLSVGEAFMGSSMSMAIDGLTKLAEGVSKLVDTVGLMPAVLGIIGLILGQFKLFKTMASTLGVTLALMKGQFVSVSTAGMTPFRAGITRVSAGLGALSVHSALATTALGVLKTAMIGLMVGTGIGLLFVGLGLGLEWIMKKMNKAREVAEEVAKTNKTMIDSYRNTEGGLESLIDTWSKYDGNIPKEGTDAYNDFLEVNQKLADSLPTVVEYVDAKGVAHLKSADAIREELKFAKELSEEEAKMAQIQFGDKIDEKTESIRKQAKEYAKLVEEGKRLEEMDGKRNTGAGRHKGSVNDNTEKIQSNKIEQMMAQQSIRDELQKTNNLISDTALRSLEASGHLKSLSDNQKGIVEGLVNNSNHIFDDTIKKMMKTTDKGKLEELQAELDSKSLQLLHASETTGRMIAEKTDALVKEATIGVTDSFKIKEITETVKGDMDKLVKSLPQDMIKFDNLGEGVGKFKQSFRDILDISDQIKGGTGNLEGLTTQLTDMGIESDVAKRIVANLGFEFNNTAIKADVMAQQQAGLIDVTEGYIDVVLEAVDATEALFGYNDTEASAISSHAKRLSELGYVYGDNAKHVEGYQESLDTLSVSLGLTEEEVLSQLPHLITMAELMQNVNFEYDANNKIVGIDRSEMTKKEIQALNEWIASGKTEGQLLDLLTGKKTVLNEETQATVEGTAKEKEAIDNLNSSYSIFKQGMNDTTRSAYIAGIKTDIENLGLNITTIKDESGNLKLAMSDGSKSLYLDALNQQLSDSGVSVDEVLKAIELLKAGGGTTPPGPVLGGVKKEAEETKTSVEEVSKSVDLLGTKRITLPTFGEFKSLELVKGVEDVARKVDLLGDSLKNAGGKVESLNGIKDALGNLQELIGTVGGDLLSLSNGNSANFDALKLKIQSVKTEVTLLKGALLDVNLALMNVNPGRVESIKTNMMNAKLSVDALKVSLTTIPSSFGSLTTGVMTATQSISNAMRLQNASVKTLGTEFKTTAIGITTSFNTVAKVVVGRTNSMISKHDSQRSSITKLATSAKTAETAISKMMNSSNTAMKSLDSYITKANQATVAGKRASASASTPPKTPQVATKTSIGETFISQMTSNNIGSAKAEAMSTFSASSEGLSGSVGGSDGGTSGTIRQANYVSGYNLNGGQFAEAMATNTSTERADLFKPDYVERERSSIESLLSTLEAKMKRIGEHTAKYRDALKSTIAYENQILAINQKELTNTTARNNAIKVRLKQLSNATKHTVAQREEYNKLEQEYDTNLGKINSLRTTIENTMTTLADKSVEIFSDFIGEITTHYDKLISDIRAKTDNVEFKIEIASYLEPDNLATQLKLLSEQANLLVQDEKTSNNKKNAMKSEYDKSVKNYGANSEQAKLAKTESDSAEEDWEDAYIAVLKVEKDIKDVREKVADNSIKQLQDYYGKMKDMALKAIEIEKRELEKAHKAKMDMYDKEKSKIDSIYDSKIKSMDKEKSESNYQAELDEKNTKRVELMNKISILSRNNTLENRKKLVELQSELTDVNKEISKFIADRQDELLRESLEAQKEAQLASIESNKEADETAYDLKVELLDKEADDIESRYTKILDDEKYWAEMNKEFIKGNSTVLLNELTQMSSTLNELNKGNFDLVADRFSQFADEVKAEFEELNKLDLSNMLYLNESVLKDFKDTINNVYSKSNATGGAVVAPSMYSPTVVAKPTATATAPKATTPTPAPKATAPSPRYHTVAKGDTLWDLALKYYKTGTKWSNIANANKSVNPKNLKIGSKLLIPFRSGGYTGEWQGNDGRVALLHKKELVLNEKQTSDILNASKVMEKVKNVIPNVGKSDFKNTLAEAGGINIENNYNLTLNIDKLTGDKKGANTVVKEIVKGLKKMGK